jgi:tRNA G18 (ribose-2'-O)-methylase SpoU
MLRIENINSFDKPDLAPYRSLRYQEQQRREGIFVAESVKVVHRLIESPLEILSIVLPESRLPEFLPGLEKRNEEIQVYLGSKTLLEGLTGFSVYQGVLAVGRVPRQPTLDELLATSHRPLLLLAADGIGNALNIGVLTRNAAAFSATALLTGETCCSPFLRRAVAASTGTLFRVPCIESENLLNTLKTLREHGIRTVAAHPREDSQPLAQTDLTGDCCLIMGSEWEGISPAVLEQCDAAAAIPMPPGVDSLNVGSASAIFLYEAARQRALKSP